jgi:hypothetical protein
VAVAALDDTTALVVHDGFREGLKWGFLRGTVWTPGGPSPPHDNLDGVPRLRPRPSGGQWLIWSPSDSFVMASTFRDGAWSEPESIRCHFTRPGQHLSNVLDISRDPGEYPAIAWMDYNTHGGITTMCVSFPTDDGFTTADVIPGTDGGGPTVARDRNGDVWVAWWKYYDGMFWIHSYTTATSSAPRITPRGDIVEVRWTLSESAPETWWALERGNEHGEYKTVGRVRARAELDMGLKDDPPPGDTVFYRVRRECVDKRYEWHSDVRSWPEVGIRVIKIRAAPRLSNVQPIEIEGAAPGPLRIRLYDLQGRLVAEQQARVTGPAREVVSFDLAEPHGRLASGIWFLRVTDSTGDESPSIKVLVLR